MSRVTRSDRLKLSRDQMKFRSATVRTAGLLSDHDDRPAVDADVPYHSHFRGLKQFLGYLQENCRSKKMATTLTVNGTISAQCVLYQ